MSYRAPSPKDWEERLFTGLCFGCNVMGLNAGAGVSIRCTDPSSGAMPPSPSMPREAACGSTILYPSEVQRIYVAMSAPNTTPAGWSAVGISARQVGNDASVVFFSRSIPLQIRAAVPRCTIQVAYQAGKEPRNNQDFTKLEKVPYKPLVNQLGPYDTVDRPGIFDQFRGWFYAVQIQVTLQGDTDPKRWIPVQTSWTTGTATAVSLDGSKTIAGRADRKSHDDTADEFALLRLPGSIDWLDAPGQGMFMTQLPGEPLFRYTSMDVKMSFVSSVYHVNYTVNNNQKCSSAKWNLVYKMENGVMVTPAFSYF